MCIVNGCSSLECYTCEPICTDAKDIGTLKKCKNESDVCHTQKTRRTVSI